MKKIKSIFCIMLLTSCLVGNVFAGNTLSNGVTTVIESVVEFLASFADGENCPVKLCQDCKPREDCRPPNDN